MAFLILLTLGMLAWRSEEPVQRAPLVTGVFPPGVTVGTRRKWTITGRNLDRVTSVIGSGDGLVFRPSPSELDGRSLVVEVEAKADASPGYREIRVEGPDGISNMAIIRVDPLPQVVEAEPNDRVPALGQVIQVGSAVAGTIRPLDVDRFRVEGEPGRKVTFDWEARRLGTSINPVMTITGPNRSAITQVRSSRGGDRDCRSSVVIPPEGWFEVELRDNTYGGDDRAKYRLRVDPAPFASGLYPLGVPRATLFNSVVSGGSLLRPVGALGFSRRSVGSWFVPDPYPSLFDGFSIFAPGRIRIVANDRNTLDEPASRPSGQPWLVPLGPTGSTVNGRIGEPGQVDRYRVEARAGDRLRFRVEAAACGSWLDSVLTVRDAKGEVLGESDDIKPTSTIEPPGTIDGSASTDSMVDLNVPSDGPITVELADRFDSGGPEFAYRLELGPPVDDFALYLIFSPTAADPGIDARILADPDALASAPPGPGHFGAFNLPPGTTTSVHFLVVPQGRPGSIEVFAEGLPAGVTCEPVVVRPASAPRSRGKTDVPFDAPPLLDSLRLRVAADASPVLGAFRVVARPRGDNSPASEHEASMVVGVDAAGGPGRPVVRTLTSFPIQVLGTSGK